MENNQVTKKQHYLPEMYLKSFTDEHGKLWQRNTRYGAYRQITPAQTGYADFLYETRWKKPPNLEKQFALTNFIENHFSLREKIYSECIESVCQKLCLDNFRISDITVDERKILAEFITNLFFRHPGIMELMELNEISQEEMSRYHANNLKVQFGNEAETVLMFIKKCEWLHSQFPGGYFQIAQTIFESMCLTVFVGTSTEFITCDWPFLFVVDEPIFLVALPLTPKCCICYSNVLRNENVNFLSDESVRRYNRLHIEKKTSSLNYLYARNKDEIEMLFEKGGEQH